MGSGCHEYQGDRNVLGAGTAYGVVGGMAVPQERVLAFHAGQQLGRLEREGVTRLLKQKIGMGQGGSEDGKGGAGEEAVKVSAGRK